MLVRVPRNIWLFFFMVFPAVRWFPSFVDPLPKMSAFYFSVLSWLLQRTLAKLDFCRAGTFNLCFWYFVR